MNRPNETIFISGNPDLFPLEYYNKYKETYEGVVPSLMEEFSNNTTYEIVYIHHNGEDNREEDYKNNQADIISGISSKEKIYQESDEEKITLLTSIIDGDEYSFSLLLTNNVTDEFRNEFCSFMREASANNETAELIEKSSIQSQNNKDKLDNYFYINTLVILIIFIVTVFYFVKKIHKLKEKDLKDSLTGINNYEYLIQYYPKKITENIRVMYHAVYIEADTEIIYKIASRKEVDDYISYISNVLCNNTNDNDILARLSDDRLIVFKNLGNSNDIYKWTENIMSIIENYGHERKKYFPSKAWAGIYELKKDDDDLNEILKKTKYSCAYAKENALIYAKCNDEIYNMYYEKNKLEERIKNALINDEFIPYISFIKSTRTGMIEGCEVVSRWQHPYRGLLTPEHYIDLMEDNQLIQYLDYKMMENSCKILEKVYNGREDSVIGFFITCNFSRKTIFSPDFVGEFTEILSKYSFPHQSLIIEVNAIRNYSGSFETENDSIIKNTGVRLVRDDYGTDNIELTKMQFEQYDGIKLDKLLVAQAEDNCGKVLIKSTVNMCHEMNKVVFAEGVEDENIAEMLSNMEVDYIQGSYIYYSLPENVAFKVLEEKNVFQD